MRSLSRTPHGQLPLHAACRNGARPNVIDMLLGRDEGMSTVMWASLMKSTFIPPPPPPPFAVFFLQADCPSIWEFVERVFACWI